MDIRHAWWTIWTIPFLPLAIYQIGLFSFECDLGMGLDLGLNWLNLAQSSNKEVLREYEVCIFVKISHSFIS